MGVRGHSHLQNVCGNSNEQVESAALKPFAEKYLAWVAQVDAALNTMKLIIFTSPTIFNQLISCKIKQNKYKLNNINQNISLNKLNKVYVQF